MKQSWCHEILVTAPEIARGVLGNLTSIHLLGILMFMSLLQSSTELAHAGYIYIYIVLCTSHCVVFYYVPPLMGQVLGKVLLTSWEIN